MAHGEGHPPPGPFPLPVSGETAARHASGRRRPGRYCYLLDVDEAQASAYHVLRALVGAPA